MGSIGNSRILRRRRTSSCVSCTRSVHGDDAQQGRRTQRNDESPAVAGLPSSTATGIRTPVSAVRGRCPSPLDDGGAPAARIARGLPVRAAPRTRRVDRSPRPGRARADSVTVYLRLRFPAAVAESVDAHGSGPCGVYKSPWRFKSSQPHESPVTTGLSPF